MLFVELVAVGEQTGRLSEAFQVLEEYFETVLAARRDLVKALIWPAIMYVGAIMTITLMLFVLGMLMPAGGKGFDPIGLGLTGTTGAMTFMFGAFSVTAAAVFLFLKVRDDDAARSAIEGAILPVPGLGGCFRAFALQRFSLAMFMTTEAGLRADRALKLSLRATANRAYMNNAERAAKQTRSGTEVADVLSGCGPHLFPPDYLEAVQIAEESGQVTEIMGKLAKQYQEEAGRKLKILTMAAGGGVYAMVALMVIAMIFRLVMTLAGIYENAMQGL
jgi:type II secretory pathway component PulF